MDLAKIIAHACGGIKGISYSNSREALELSYKRGRRFIEIDINQTSDGKYVLIHDWQETAEKLFGVRGQPDLKKFKTLKMEEGLTQQSFEEVIKWFENHQDTYLVSDVKGGLGNQEIMHYIKTNHPILVKRYIPQIFYFEEFEIAIKLGFQHIILALYHINPSEEEILDFVQNHKLLAVAMNQEKTKTDLPRKLKQLGITSITHTINDEESLSKLKQRSVDTVFSDFL